MKHYTCDKCGMPMDRVHTIDIDGRHYDICPKCREEIIQELDVLKEKGEQILKRITGK